MARGDDRFEWREAEIEKRARELDATLHNLRSRGASVEQRRSAIEAVLRKFVADLNVQIAEKTALKQALIDLEERIKGYTRSRDKSEEAWRLFRSGEIDSRELEMRLHRALWE